MAEGPDDSQKTEDPTAKRLQDSLQKGDVAKSQDIVSWTTLAAGAALIGLYAQEATPAFTARLAALLGGAEAIPFDAGGLMRLLLDTGLALLLLLGLPFAIMVLAAVLGHLVQHPLVFAPDRLSLDLAKLSPLKGFQKLFGLEGLVNLGKGILKILMVGAAGFLVLWPERERLALLPTLDLAVVLPFALTLTLQMLGAMLAVLAVIALADYAYQRYARFERLRMSRQEIKDEHKQMEGDPLVKAKIARVRQERARQRMMANVPKATAVVVNPSHYAVALAYESGKMRAPVCVAKGVDALALRIREVAKAHDVPIIENPPLARTLYVAVEVDAEIPPAHYKAVAEIIGYVYRLKGRARSR